MTREVECLDRFREWRQGLLGDQQESTGDRVLLLAELGPDLGRPVVDRIHTSRHQKRKFKRLRTSVRRAWRWLHGVQRRAPTLFAHWAFGAIA